VKGSFPAAGRRGRFGSGFNLQYWEKKITFQKVYSEKELFKTKCHKLPSKNTLS
jgi:hypothetical protein